MERLINAEEAEQAIFITARKFFEGKISGITYLSDMRPLNSRKEDAVCKVSALDAMQTQKGFAKINVFVGDLPSANAVANKTRLREILAYGDALLQALNEDNANYDFTYQLAPCIMQSADTKEHIAHFDLQFRVITF